MKISEIKNKHPLIFKLILLFLSVSTITIFAAVLSGPSNPTINSIPVFSNNKQLTNSGVIIDANTNVSGIFTLNILNMTVTNFYIGSNALSSWPTTPTQYGDAYFGNSNGFIYLLTSTNTGSLTWTKTNLIAPQ